MAIVGIDHVQLAMPAGREDEARDFYGRLLDIPEKPKPAALAKRGGIWFDNGAVTIHLGVEADFVRPRKRIRPCLWTIFGSLSSVFARAALSRTIWLAITGSTSAILSETDLN